MNYYYKHCIDKYRRTKKGWVTSLYASQRQHSKRRGHKMPEYTKEELLEWVSKQGNCEELFTAWEDSGFKRNLRPSVDRIDDNRGYFFDNIQLVTALENFKNSHRRNKRGEYKNISKEVVQLALDGDIIRMFKSTMDAHRTGGFNQSHIASVCRGERKTHGGFKWKYVS